MRAGTIVAAARAAALLGVALASGGCLSKTVPEPTRYFRPALEEPPAALLDAKAPPVARIGGPATAAPAPASRTPLRVRRVSAGAHLRDRFATRVSEVEVGFDDLLRWTEPPAVYLERALARELFEARPFARSESGAVARLDVELRSFEEVREDGASRALVEVWVSLGDARDATVLERSFAAVVPFERRGPEGFARAAGQALASAVKSAAAAIEQVARAPAAAR